MKVFGDLALFPDEVRFVTIVAAPRSGMGVGPVALVGVVILEGQPPMYTSAESAQKLIDHFSVVGGVTDLTESASTAASTAECGK